MQPVEGRPPQFSMDDILQREADGEHGKRLLDYLNGLDETGPPPPYYERTRAGNSKHIIEDAPESVVQAPLQQIELDAKEI